MKKWTDLYFSPSDAFNNASFSHMTVFAFVAGRGRQGKFFQDFCISRTRSTYKLIHLFPQDTEDSAIPLEKQGQIHVFLQSSQVLLLTVPTQLFRINQNLPNQSEPELQASSVWRLAHWKLGLVLPSVASKNIASHKEWSLMTATWQSLPKEGDHRQPQREGTKAANWRVWTTILTGTQLKQHSRTERAWEEEA